MKCSDIKKVVYCNPNGNTLDLDAIPATLKHLADEYGLDLNPDFQRGHVWSREQRIKFVEYVLRGGAVAPLRFNSPTYGGADARKSDMSEAVVIVDGKQRLTALILFIDNMLPVFGGHYLSDFEDADLLLRGSSVTYTVNTIKTRKELLEWYLEMNEGQVAHTPEELERIRQLINNGE